MKSVLFFLCFVACSLSLSAVADTHKVSLEWDEETWVNVEAYDQDLVVVDVPAGHRIHPFSKVVSEDNVVEGSCEPVSITQNSERVVFTYQLQFTGPEDGFNGCRVVISSGHPDHEDGFGLINLKLGLLIND